MRNFKAVFVLLLVFACMGRAAVAATVTITSTSDTYLHQATAATAYGTAAIVKVDTSDGGGAAQGLLYFDIIGAGANQVPPGATISSATLTFRTNNSGNGGNFHRMLVPWTETSTWNSLTTGIQANNIEARSTADFSTGAVVVGTRAFDVTASVAAWAAGEANNGWAILPLGSDGWDFYSRQGTTPPSLSVTYTTGGGPLPPTASLTANPTTINAGSSTTLTWSSANTTSCTGTNFSTGGAVSGSTTSTPASSTTYSLSCTGDGGTAIATASVTVQTGGTTNPFDVRVSAAADDAEESAAGAVNLTSSDLEIVQDTTTQTVGMRFANIQVPRNAVISNAYIQFQVDEVSTAAASLTFQGVAADNPGAFTTASTNVSSRLRTATAVSWVPPGWPTINVATADQRTPNLAPIIQEIVNRQGWASGNALAIIITGSGKRVAEAYDGVVSAAPLLHIDWSSGTSDTTPPSVSITSPSPGTTLTGIATITANANDDSGVQSVQFRLGGVNRCTADTTAPYTCALDTRPEANGAATLTAVATDTSGNTATSDPVTVTIDNPPTQETILRVPEDYATPQAAINAAANGNVVLLGPGTYAGGITISGKTITLASYFHTTGDPSYINITTISGGTTGVNIAANSPNVIVKGLRFTGGSDSLVLRAPGGQAISNFFDHSGTDALSFEVIGGIARDNTCIGAGDDCIDADVPTTDLLIENNILETPRDDGIEIRNEPLNGGTVPLPNLVTVTIRGNKIISTDDDGIQLIDAPNLQNRRFVIERNLITGSGKVGLGLMDNGVTVEDYRAASMPERVHVFNNTFDGNNYGITGGDNLIAVNNIITRSRTLGMKNIDGGSIVAHTLFWSNAQDQIGSNMDTATTYSGSPLYAADFTLGTGSPAIDAGTATFTHNGETVLTIPPSGYAGARPDLGRYESGM